MVSEAEFAQIVNQTKKVVLSAVSRNLPAEHYHAIDDVVQETYIRAYRSLVKGKFREESAISTWLYTIARNESLRMLKKIGREETKRKKAAEKQQDSFFKEVDAHEMPDYTYLLERLPDVQRQVVELYLEGQPEKVIAERLDIARGTVKSRLSRARESLRELVHEEVSNGRI